MSAGAVVSDLTEFELAYLGARDEIGRRAVSELRRRRAMPGDATAGVAELRDKLHAAHRELARRCRRDEELARHVPAIAARLQSLAADATLDLRGDPAAGPAWAWDRDPAIVWAGIDGGHP